MLFNSPVFPLFLAAVLLLYKLLGKSWRAQNAMLLAASYLFYAWWDWRFLGLIVLSTAVDFFVGLGLQKRKSKLLLAVSLATNLTILGLFKYHDFFMGELNTALLEGGVALKFRLLEVALPVGLSFYTFQSMAYSVDVYRGRVQATRNPLTFALFVSFFPQLVAGPIERSERLMPQLEGPRKRTRRQFAQGAHLILWGLFKKVFVADNLAVLVQSVYDSPDQTSGFMVLVAGYAFTWQIYCDFSGYTDIARGIAKWLGIELMVNFRLPFFAASPREVWHRWHISLSEWLRDYLYIGLGGNRKGSVRAGVNMLVTMVLGGLWHGANWTFLVWGAYHGVALAIQRVLPRVKVPRVLGIVLTFHFTMLGFMIFRADSMAQLVDLWTVMVTNFTPVVADRYPLTQLLILIAFPLLVEFLQYRNDSDIDLFMRWPRWIQAPLVVGMVLAIVVLGATYGQAFIYFQF
jgi:alginate O-acetyltransferase complex protein AlgI